MPPENKANPTEPTQGNSPVTPESPLKQIRTFEGDVASALQQQRESLVSIQQQEGQLRKSTGGTVRDLAGNDNGKRKEVFLFTLGSICLLLLGGLGSWYGYQEFVRRAGPPLVEVLENRLIAAQSTTELELTELTRGTLFSTLASESNSLNSSELKHFVLRKASSSPETLSPLATTADFFKLIGSTAPGSLVRAFNPIFMLGSLGQNHFLIIKLDSFENAFAGMLAWEKDMAADIGPLFQTAPLLQNIGPESVFRDMVSRNKDLRVLYAPTAPGAATTTPALLYTFFNSEMLIITDSIEAMRTLVDRLTQELLSR